ncbi:MAG: hypothetical protein GY832_36500, partial [Chloroflexi bacterium]|nr:hypothetical protein [Chloroflexota bacterium]
MQSQYTGTRTMLNLKTPHILSTTTFSLHKLRHIALIIRDIRAQKLTLEKLLLGGLLLHQQVLRRLALCRSELHCRELERRWLCDRRDRCDRLSGDALGELRVLRLHHRR